jgi:hypothetical protein
MTSKRSEILSVLERLGRCYPNWRFSQLVANMADMMEAGIWDVEDEQLLAEARRHLKHRLKCLGLGVENPVQA